ncbi:MAG: alpha/beta fold hydrolase [Candidatus Aquilonibacter sp.]
MTMAEGFYLPLSSGRIRVERFGPPSARPVICVHGISSNARVFTPIRDTLVAKGRQVIAPDLRGRGLSEKSEAGTYGWLRHARDIFEIAERLKLTEFDLVGHSMGAFVGMNAVAIDQRKQIGKIVLIDGLGLPSAGAAAALARNATRLNWIYRNADDYVTAVRSLGLASPWTDHWELHYRYEVEPTERGVRARTKLGAVLEDAAYAATHSPSTLWGSLCIPVLLLRAARPLAAPNGFVVTRHDLSAFLRSTPAAIVQEIDANHFGIVMHDDALSAIRGFLC